MQSLTAWIDHRADSKGAALAFYTLFSMTPILVLAITVAGYFFGAEAAQGEIVAQVQGLVGPSGAQAIQSLLAGVSNPAAGLLATLVASILLLLAATSVFAELKGSLGKYAIGLYLGNSGVASSFGVAGSLIALLLWVYYSAQIFLHRGGIHPAVRAGVRQPAGGGGRGAPYGLMNDLYFTVASENRRMH